MDAGTDDEDEGSDTEDLLEAEDVHDDFEVDA
jgi:hypothetical protein